MGLKCGLEKIGHSVVFISYVGRLGDQGVELLVERFGGLPNRGGFSSMTIRDDGRTYVMVVPGPLSFSVTRISTGANKPALMSCRIIVKE